MKKKNSAELEKLVMETVIRRLEDRIRMWRKSMEGKSLGTALPLYVSLWPDVECA